ncbi:MAG TPA: hypothetical protein VD931_23205 [Baekduia sp.]|nr:hypothetical protein [Baekduia sp.]
MDKSQQDRFRKAVDEKAGAADAAARSTGLPAEEGGGETSLRDHAAQTDASRNEPGDVDPRTKNSRHGQVTADKWNQ